MVVAPIFGRGPKEKTKASKKRSKLRSKLFGVKMIGKVQKGQKI